MGAGLRLRKQRRARRRTLARWLPLAGSGSHSTPGVVGGRSETCIPMLLALFREQSFERSLPTRAERWNAQGAF